MVVNNWVAASEFDMKLLEVAPDFVSSQAGILMTILQYLKAKTKPGTAVPINSIAKMMSNMGYSFNFDDFQALYRDNNHIQNLVTDYNQNSITIGQDEQMLQGQPNPEAQANTVDQMASKAASL